MIAGRLPIRLMGFSFGGVNRPVERVAFRVAKRLRIAPLADALLAADSSGLYRLIESSIRRARRLPRVAADSSGFRLGKVVSHLTR